MLIVEGGVGRGSMIDNQHNFVNPPQIHILSILEGEKGIQREGIDSQQFCQHFTVHVNCSSLIIDPGRGQKLCSPIMSVRSTGLHLVTLNDLCANLIDTHQVIKFSIKSNIKMFMTVLQAPHIP